MKQALMKLGFSAGVHCPYCCQSAALVYGNIVYPHREDLFSKKFYLCQSCGAYVGCHDGTDVPLGRLANAELRRAKMKVHAEFDILWKNKWLSRTKAYAWLAEELGIPASLCHVGMFDVETCNRAVVACQKLRLSKGD